MILGRYNKLEPKEQKQLDSDVDSLIAHRKWFPQSGPQTLAYFSKADELLFGGSAGGGSTGGGGSGGSPSRSTTRPTRK